VAAQTPTARARFPAAAGYHRAVTVESAAQSGPGAVAPMPIPEGLRAPGTGHGRFEAVASVDDLPDGAMLRVTRGDLDILIANTDAGLVATEDRCPHMAAPLSHGQLDGCVVQCPLHQGRFDLATGDVIQFPTTGGLTADGEPVPPWQPPDRPPRPEPSDEKARARAGTRVRRLRYFPLRVNGDRIEVVLPQ
jgi:3-phenylpropionate/trans-cinnamate dioxygenase ferredoxin subunit